MNPCFLFISIQHLIYVNQRADLAVTAQDCIRFHRLLHADPDDLLRMRRCLDRETILILHLLDDLSESWLCRLENLDLLSAAHMVALLHCRPARVIIRANETDEIRCLLIR